MNVDHTDQSPLETGSPVTNPVPKADAIDVDIGDLSPLAADRAADGTRSKLTAAPPPIPARARRSSTLPPPIPRAARGSNAPKLVEPKATPEMMASWQINPEGPLTRPSSPPPIPVAAKSMTMRAVEPPPVAPATPAALPTTIELVRAIDIAKPEPALVAPLVTGNAPSVMASTTSSAALPVVQQEIIPSPRESRVAPMPTSQPGADVADLPMWPAMAPTMGAVLASRTASRDSARLPAPRGRNTLPPPIPSAPTLVATPVLVAPEAVAKKVSALDGSDGWVFDDEYEEREVDGEVVPTTYFERTEPPPRKRPAYLIAAGAAAAAIAVIVAIAMHGSPTPKTPVAVAPAPVAVAPTPPPAPVAVAPAPAPVQPAVAPVAAPIAAPSLTTLPITSWPNGATVTLVDNGNATVLGRTPVSAALDPSHSYAVVLAVVGRPTVIKHVDFATMHEVAVDLDPDQPAAKPLVAPASVPTPAAHHHHRDHAVVAAMPAPAPPVREPAKPKQVAIAAPVAPAGTGILMVSAKPPCEIIVDGKSLHLTTPQRSIALSPGAHAVTLVNASIGIKKTIAVKVEAKKPTKLIQDFTKS